MECGALVGINGTCVITLTSEVELDLLLTDLLNLEIEGGIEGLLLIQATEDERIAIQGGIVSNLYRLEFALAISIQLGLERIELGGNLTTNLGSVNLPSKGRDSEHVVQVIGSDGDGTIILVAAQERTIGLTDEVLNGIAIKRERIHE